MQARKVFASACNQKIPPDQTWEVPKVKRNECFISVLEDMMDDHLSECMETEKETKTMEQHHRMGHCAKHFLIKVSCVSYWSDS